MIDKRTLQKKSETMGNQWKTSARQNKNNGKPMEIYLSKQNQNHDKENKSKNNINKPITTTCITEQYFQIISSASASATHLKLILK